MRRHVQDFYDKVRQSLPEMRQGFPSHAADHQGSQPVFQPGQKGKRLAMAIAKRVNETGGWGAANIEANPTWTA